MAEAVNRDRHSSSDHSINVMLLAVIVKFFLSHVGLTYLDVVELVIGADDFNQDKLTILVDISNLLVVFNSASNFFIYLAWGKKFRSTLIECLISEGLCCCCATPSVNVNGMAKEPPSGPFSSVYYQKKLPTSMSTQMPTGGVSGRGSYNGYYLNASATSRTPNSLREEKGEGSELLCKTATSSSSPTQISLKPLQKQTSSGKEKEVRWLTKEGDSEYSPSILTLNSARTPASLTDRAEDSSPLTDTETVVIMV